MSFLSSRLNTHALSNTSSSIFRRAFTTTPTRSLARISLIGRLGTQPEHATTNGGKEYFKFPLAVSTGPPNDQGQRPTSWFRIANFDPPAEGTKARDYVAGLEKGTLVFLEGDVSVSNYTDAETGKTHSLTNIVQRRMEVLSRPRGTAGGDADSTASV